MMQICGSSLPHRARGDAAAEPLSPDRTRQAPRSMRPRHLVPPRAAQVERAFILRALESPSICLSFLLLTCVRPAVLLVSQGSYGGRFSSSVGRKLPRA